MSDNPSCRYVDGDAEASVSYYPYELAGMPSPDAYNHSLKYLPTLWSAELWGRNSASSWVNSFPIPFSKQLRITLQFTAPSGHATIYYQGHGLLNVLPMFGRLPIPPNARLVIQRNRLVLPRLHYLNVSDFKVGSGIVAAIAIAFTAPNQNTLEGCFHWCVRRTQSAVRRRNLRFTTEPSHVVTAALRYSTSNSPYPGQLHSTGTEDEFLSSYYFDLGPFESKTAGLLYKSVPSYSGDPVATAMWRTYQVGIRSTFARLHTARERQRCRAAGPALDFLRRRRLHMAQRRHFRRRHWRQVHDRAG
jgi:hypothetical protein